MVNWRNGTIPSLLFTLGVVAAVAALCWGAGGTFEHRCGKIYQGAAQERCVKRLSEDGPLYEENIRGWQ